MCVSIADAASGRLRAALAMLWMVGAFAGPAGSQVPSETPPHDIPHLTGVAADGNGEDWGARGFRVEVLVPLAGDLPGLGDFDVSMRLGWNDEGLLVLILGRDDAGVESADEGTLWASDSIELFLAPRRGASDWCQWVIAPGLDPEHPELRWHTHHSRKAEALRGLPGAAEVAGARGEGAYTLEVLLPWSSLAIDPKRGREVGFQIIANDQDPEGYRERLLWYPGQRTSRDSNHMHRLHLAEEATRHIRVLTRRTYDTERTKPVIGVTTAPEHVGEQVTLESRGRIVATGQLALDELGRPTVDLVLPKAVFARGEGRVPFTVGLAGEEADTFSLPAAVADIARLVAEQDELRERFGLDRPWDDMAEAPALIRRHRGMVAEALRLVEEGRSPVNEDMVEALSRHAEMVVAVGSGADYLGSQRNEFWSAYYSQADGSGQVFVTMVPEDFDEGREYPLVVQLHGANELPKPGWDLRHASQDYLEVWPTGRGTNGYHGLGEDDVLQVIEHMKRWYTIDPNRVYVTGRSMGGGGSWMIASRHPDLFAATAPLYGYPLPVGLENLRNVPVFNQHGARDWLVPISQSRYAVNALERMGYAVAHKECAECGHNVPEYGAVEWMLERRRPEAPATITYTTDTRDRGRAYWLQVRRFADPHRLARVVATVNGRGKGQLLTVVADNVAVLELDVDAMPVTRQDRLLVQAGEVFAEVAEPLPKRLFLVRDEGRWSVTEAWSEPGPSDVRRYLPGAAAGLYTGEPLMIVYGTQGDENRTQLLRQAAEAMAKWPGSYQESVVGRFPVRSDAQVSDIDLERYNLVLTGSAGDNGLVARILPHLPVQVTDANDLMAGEREPVSLDSAGIQLAHYNPLSPQRLIFWVSTGADGDAARQWLMNPEETMAGARGGFRRVDAADLVVRALDGSIRRQMQFTHGWKWRQLEGEARRLPEEMSRRLELTQASLRVMRAATGADLALGWGSDSEEAACDPRWMTLADLAVAQIPGETLMARLMGREILDIHAHWLATGELASEPTLDPDNIAPERSYQVAMPLDLSWPLAARERALRDVRVGPAWPQEALWQEIFGQ